MQTNGWPASLVNIGENADFFYGCKALFLLQRCRKIKSKLHAASLET